jgi:uncharacterized protein with FMN-binding domain
MSLTGCGPKVFNNGTYVGVSPADDNGYAIAEVTIKDDKITDVKITEFDSTAVQKDMEAYPWEPAKQANKELPGRFIGRQDANIDAFSGATASSTKYISAVEHALEKARIKPQITTQYFDGTFMGRSEADDKGYGIAFVTVEGDQIKAVRLLEVTGENELRDYATCQYTVVLEAKDHLERAFVEQNGPEVDTFSGATNSSQKWIEAVSNALQAARLK